MTTATIAQHAEEQVRRSVKALRAATGTSIQLMCEHASISRGTYFSRMNGTTPFTAGEVAALAVLFGVEVGDLYSGRISLASVSQTSAGLDGVTAHNSPCAPAPVIPLRTLSDAA